MKKNFLFLLILTFYFLPLKSQEYGAVFQKHYSAQDYKADAQNWAVCQDNRGIMYFGNTSKLLEFDGNSWKQYSTPNNSVIRSIDIDKNGIIYVGSSGEFGFFKANSSGKLEYTSLSDSIKDDTIIFQDIWATIATEESIYYISDYKTFIWKNNEIYVQDIKVSPFYGNYINKQLYFIDLLRGIFILEDTIQTFLPNTQQIVKKSGFLHILEHDDPDKLFLISSRKGLYEYNLTSNEATKISSEIENYIYENAAYSASKIDTNLYAIGTSTEGILIIDSKGNLKNVINKKRGLASNSVYYLHTDKDKNLWAGLQNGICRIDLSEPIQYFSDNQGVGDYILDALKFENRLFLAAMNGSHYLSNYELKIEDDNHQFVEYENTGGIWDLYIYNNFVLGGGYYGITQYNDTIAKNIFSEGDIIFSITSTPKFPNYLFIGTKTGVSFLKVIKKDKNNFLELDSLTKITETKEEIRYLTTDTEGNIWASSKYDGVFLLRFLSDDINDYQLTKFTDNGIPNLNSCKVELIDNEIKILTKKGIYKPTFPNKNLPDSLMKFETDDIFGDYFSKDSSLITEIFKIEDNKYMFFADNKTSGIIEKENEDIVLDTLLFKRIPYISKLRFSDDNKIYICSNDAFYIYDLNKKNQKNNDYNVLIREVKINSDSLIFGGTFFNENNEEYSTQIAQIENFIPKINYNFNSINIEFSANFYEESEKTLYSYLFDGYSENWSEWSVENKANLTNIPNGKYTFKVKAKNIYGIESQITEYKFIILRPWYKKWWAVIIWLSIIILIFYFVIRINIYRLEIKNKKLEEIVEKRTAEISKQNLELQQQKEEILSQSEELHSQAEELQVINHELEKLSVVASETDNAVMIFNFNLELEWINNAFIRLYGYNLEEIKFYTIHQLSSNPNISNVINDCINNKKSVSYEALVLNKNKKEIWIHTTLTPIFDYEGKLSKIIAIESNIHDLKIAQKEIADKNKLITSSLYYAVSIQNSILPDKKEIKKHFDFFAIYLPKDIVSGDFYWFVTTEKYFFAAVVDCTGHGVPGAFMSLIGSRLMNEIVLEKGFLETPEILNLLDLSIRKALKQETTENIDGMDVALCRIEKINPENNKIQFSGAKQPFYFFSLKNKSLTKIKGDIRKIGGYNSKFVDMKFSEHNVSLSKGDVIFLKSDGYEDQCNFERKKFGKGKLKRLLEEIATLPLDQQKNILENELAKWQETTEQRDDITIFGLKF